MAKKYKSKVEYLRTQTSARLLKFANNSKSPNYRASVQVLNERLKKTEYQATQTNKKLVAQFGYMSKVETVDKNLTGKELAQNFTQIMDVNKEIVKEYRQNVEGVNVILKGVYDEKGKLTHRGYVAEKYADALQELISEGYTNEEAVEELKKRGYTQENMRDIAEEIIRLNRFGYKYTDADEILEQGLKGKLFVNRDYTKAVRYKDTSEFR